MTKVWKHISESFIDYPDNQSIAYCILLPGCINNCDGCQNPWLQRESPPMPGFHEKTYEDLEKQLDEVCSKDNQTKVVISGGDPLSPMNIEYTKGFIEKYKDKYDFCIYTGHDVEYVKEHNVSGFKFLKCGKFDIKNKRESEKTDEKMLFASPNQKLYDKNYNLISKGGIYYFN